MQAQHAGLASSCLLHLKVLAHSDAELGGVTAADRQAVEAARQGLREEIEEYCLVE